MAGAHPRRWRPWLPATAVVIACTAISEAMAAYLDLANIAMVYLAGVAYLALREGARAAVAMVVASIFLFDLIFVPPRWGLNPLNPHHFFTFAVMLAVGLLISRLADQVRQQAALAEGRAQRAQALSALAGSLAAARTEADIATTLSSAAQAAFGTPCELQPGGALRLPDGRALTGEEQELLHGFERQAVLALERCAFERSSAEALVQAQTERLRNTLLSGISHDFRTPLTTIVGAATSLIEQDRLLDAQMRMTLTRSVLQEARRLSALVRDLLDLTRMEEGAVQPSLEWCPADDLVEEALAAVGTRLGSHQIRTDIPPDAIVWCDARLLEQALVNMVDNALRHTPPGSRIVVSVRAGAGHWTLGVADNGPGLPPGTEQDVFRKFHRAHSEPAGSGLGLGLAICAAVAKLHHGTIEAFNAGGATFRLTLPQHGQPPLMESGT
ncbi:MAG: ATP-binding protein [Pseudomonadota bacterium]